MLLISGVSVSNLYLGYVPIARADAGASPPIPPGKIHVVVAPATVAPVHELHWTSGAFPVLNGKTIPPPLAVPISGPFAYSTHWYAGSAFSGISQHGSWMFTEITTPSSTPKSDEFYYVLASVWDNSGSYDQIGFADYFGVWGLTYSWTSGPCTNPTYNFSPNAMNLALGTTYDFYITVNGGYTDFEAYVGSTLVWSLSPAAPTGATSLSVAHSYCGDYDYTDYVEVWQTDVFGGYPLFIFTFSQNQWYNGNSWVAASWTAFTAGLAPAAVSVLISGQTVSVEGTTQTLTTMTVSYSVFGGGTPTVPLFHYVLEGVSKSLTLTKTGKVVSVDAGSSWSVSPNPLSSSSSSSTAQWAGDPSLLEGTASSSATIVFTYYHQYLQTLSYSIVGGGSGYSAPTFTANSLGSSLGQVLTTTPTGYWFDSGASWSITKFLPGSSTTEQWHTSSAAGGKISGSATRSPAYQHQFYLTIQVNPSGAGATTPSNSRWYNAGQTVTIKATANPGHTFLSWTGTITGTSRTMTIIMNLAITETANFS